MVSFVQFEIDLLTNIKLDRVILAIVSDLRIRSNEVNSSFGIFLV